MYRVLARGERSALWRGRAWQRPRGLDVDRLAACAQALVGTHDFTAFTPTDTYHVRFSRDVFSANWRVASELTPRMLEFTIEADTFMRQMNRVLVGTMVEVAAGKRTVDEFRALLRGAPRSQAGMTAPAHGLYLLGVGYGGRRVLARP
jgi:tRNA pseudouridine38-40 synthase